MKPILLDGHSLTIPALYSIAVHHAPVKITPRATREMVRSRALVEQWIAKGETVYGVTTGFGEFASVKIGQANIEQLQVNLIRSHAAGAGDPLPSSIVRAMMALRINALAKGFSGIRIETVGLLVAMLNKNIIPVIPSQGSVGASGDLVQLSHLVLAMIGEGRVYAPGFGKRASEKIIGAAESLRQHGLNPARLAAKEGLALINGTQMMTAYAALAAFEARQLATSVDVAAAISVEALRGSDTPFDARIHRLRPYKGQQEAARNMRKMMAESMLRESHRYGDSRVQDAYSMRCIPQVHGASRDAIEYVWGKVSIELNSANDNPLIFPSDGEHLEGGNFHGQPIALAMDFLGIALSEFANISERRIERLVNGSLSGLPKFLTENGGLNSGLMIAQYTAASIVSENKVLAHPASVDSIPTSANQEDHNSMGSISAQKAWRILKNAQTVIAIEFLCACQGLDFARKLNATKSLRAGKGTEAAYRSVRSSVPTLRDDRVLHTDIQKVIPLVVSGIINRHVEREIGKLD
jgi:histidine ammonia-lyase